MHSFLSVLDFRCDVITYLTSCLTVPEMIDGNLELSGKQTLLSPKLL